MDEELKKLLEENLKLTQEIHTMTKKINKFVIWSRIFGFLKILIIVVPIILGIIYLPPLLKDVFGQYKDLLGIGGGSKGLLGDSENLNLENIDVNQLPPELQKLLNK
jgi:hypothetical protein